MVDRTPQLVAYLARTEGWVPALELADHLGVSTRSVRSYVTALKAAAHPLEVVASSPGGYRLDRDAWAAYARSPESASGTPAGPRERLTYLISRLTAAEAGLDVHELASALFVSDSTLEQDLRRVRGLATDAGLTLDRDGALVALSGPEPAHRRLISRMFHDEHAGGVLDLGEVQQAFGIAGLAAFKTDVMALLERSGYAVNEFGLDRVLVHTAIAVERSRDHPVDESEEAPDDLRAGLAGLVAEHFDARLPAGELRALAVQLTTRVGTRAVGPGDAPAEELELVRRIVQRASEEYLIDLDDEAFLHRLASHVGNLVTRARSGVRNDNPLTRSIKSGYPLTYELAVFVASEVAREFDIPIDDDEIAYVALHIGALLEGRAEPAERVGVTLVSPTYHDLAGLLENRILTALGSEVRIERVVTRTDADPAEFPGLVVTTLPRPVLPGNAVLVQPIPTDDDIDAVRAALGRVRRQRRRAAIGQGLRRYLDPDLFFVDLDARDPESAIRALGDAMISAGIVDEGYVNAALERERISSTRFADAVAVPHALAMTARRTVIAVALFSEPIRWGDGDVSVVAFTAFSESGRSAFQTVFEQLVGVFSDRAAVQRLVRDARDYASFVDELTHVLDD